MLVCEFCALRVVTARVGYVLSGFLTSLRFRLVCVFERRDLRLYVLIREDVKV